MDGSTWSHLHVCSRMSSIGMELSTNPVSTHTHTHITHSHTHPHVHTHHTHTRPHIHTHHTHTHTHTHVSVCICVCVCVQAGFGIELPERVGVPLNQITNYFFSWELTKSIMAKWIHWQCLANQFPLWILFATFCLIPGLQNRSKWVRTLVAVLRFSFEQIPLGKLWTPLYFQLWEVPLLSFKRDSFDIK